VAAALLNETNAIPVVFLDGPEAAVHTFINDWSHPGGYVMGFIYFVNSIFGKWLQLLKEIMPEIDRVAYLFNPESTVPGNYPISEIEAAARAIKVELIAAPVRDAAGIIAAISALITERRDGAIVLPGPFVATHQQDIFATANRFAVPIIYPFRYYVEKGGLFSYGVDEPDLYRGAASYNDRILRGANVGNLPVQAPTRFELALNTKAAKAIGIEIPSSILRRADAVIE
jgi:putative ABC transport system substrate-binding protein